jgi:hypothetical protein
VESFFVGIAGNIVSAALIAIIPVAAIVIILNRRQREIAGFFGLNSQVRQVQILLSRYKPEAQTEHLSSGAESKGFTGETVAVEEYQGAQAIARLFESRWIVASVASVITKSLEGGRDYGSVQVSVMPGPEPKRPGHKVPLPHAATVVLMGTGARESNELAEQFLGPAGDRSVFRFVKDDNGRAFERAADGYTRETFYASRYEPGQLAVLQRATMPDGQVVFLCAGKDVSGSRMVAEYLAENWKKFYEQYNGRHNGDFARLYVFHPLRGPEVLSNWP